MFSKREGEGKQEDNKVPRAFIDVPTIYLTVEMKYSMRLLWSIACCIGGGEGRRGGDWVPFQEFIN